MPGSTDIVVVGGGMVGAMTALAFARCDLTVTVVEKKSPAPFDPLEHDIRVSAISHATLEMFKAVDAWQTMHNTRVCPYKRMLVWDNASTARTRFNSADIGYPQLGYIVENSLIQTALWQQLQQQANVEIQCPASIETLDLQEDGASLTLDNGQTLNAEMVVAADGSQSTVRSLAGIEVDGESYQQHALVATVKTEIAQQDITWQRFTDTGPQAFLPLVGNRASMVWYHSAERVAELNVRWNLNSRINWESCWQLSKWVVFRCNGVMHSSMCYHALRWLVMRHMQSIRWPDKVLTSECLMQRRLFRV